MDMYMHTCVHAHSRTHALTHARAHAHTHTNIHTHTHTHTHTHRIMDTERKLPMHRVPLLSRTLRACLEQAAGWRLLDAAAKV